MKRTEIYKKTYAVEASSDPEDRGEEYISNPDNLTDSLREMCINQKQMFDISKITREYSFLYYDGKVIIGINVDGNKFNKQYERKICLEIMPKNAKTPKELSDLLASNGFKEVKE